MPKWMPGGADILREAVIVMAGAALAALIVKLLPAEIRGLFNFTGTNH